MKPKSALRSFLAITGSTLLAISYTHAATLYWDGTDTDANANGGAGTWDNLSSLNWDTAATAGVASQWDNSNLDTAVFGGAAGNVGLGANITFGGLTFNTTGYVINATGSTYSFGAGNNTILFNNIAAASINNGTSGGSGNVIIKAANPSTAGTLTLGGGTIGGWNGTTTINAGMTVLLNTTSSALSNITGISLNGGGISTASTNSTQAAVDRIANGANITSNGGTFTFTNSAGANINYAETIGSTALITGQLNLVMPTNQNNATNNSQTLTLSGLTRTGGATNTSAVTFAAGTTGPQELTGDNMIVVTGAGTTSGWISGDSSNTIIAPWATTGTAAAAQTDYAVFSSDYVVPANTVASDQGTWSITAKSYTLANASGSVANGKLTATRSINSLRNATATASATATNGGAAALDYFTLVGHTFVDGDAVSASGTGGLTTGSPLGAYYVINSGVGGADRFQLSLTPGGSPIDLTNATAGQIAAGITLGTNDLGTYGILNGTTAGLPIVSSGGSLTLPASGAGNLHVTTGSGIITIAAPIKDFDGSSPLTLVKGGTAGTLSQQFATYTGVLVLSGSNTFTGGTVLNAGSLFITSQNALGASQADRKVTANGIVTLAAPNSTTYNLGALTVNAGAVLTAENSSARVFNFTSASGTGVMIHSGNGSGTLSLGDASAFTGNLQSLGGSSSVGNIVFSSLSDASGAGNLQGGGTTIGGKITYSGSAPLTLTNRQVEFLDNGSAGASLTLVNNSGTANTWVISTNLVAGTAASARTLGFDGTNTGANAFAGTITNTAGGGVISVTKSGTGTWALSGTNTYTGPTTLTAGTLSVGAASNLGASASNLVFNGSSPTVGGTLQITGTALTSFTGSGHAVSFTAAKLVGLDIADAANTFTADQVLNQTTGGLTKAGAGTLVLNQANTYTGATTAGGGVLKLDNATALSGGIAATGGTSNLTITGGGIVGLTANSGNFLRARGTTAAQVQWTGSGGFAAYGADRTVNLGGAAAVMTWNNSGFVPGAQSLVLASADSDGTLIWENPISFAGSVRTIQVNNGSSAIDARLNGVLSAGTSSGLNKTGAGTLEITNSANSYSGATTVSEGTLRLGASNVLPDTTNVTIAAATLDVGAGFSDSTGTGALDVTAAAAINLGDGTSQLAFADSSAVDWTDIPGTLNITGTLGATSLRFGTTSGGLTSGQLAVISVNGSGLGTYILDADGYLVSGGGGPGPLDHFAISAIGSLQTVGTPITGITLTAQDATNQTVTSFTGTVNFGGTGGFTGTSATFTSGVLNGVSVTPTNAGSGLTFTVTDIGSGKSGTATITTIQTQYQAWSGGALFDADANGDGVKNGLAFLLGASGPSAAVAQPTVSQTGGNLKLTFSMLNAAKRGSATLNVQHSADLGISDPWISVPVLDANSGPTSGVTMSLITGDPLNGVEATISSSEAVSGKLFGRLKAQQ